MKKQEEQYDDRIIEARWDFEQQAWRFMRIRDDKRDENHISVVESIIKTIIEPVHQKDARLLPWFLPFRLSRSASPLLRTSE
jgi:mRNA guanylyltransferase